MGLLFVGIWLFPWCPAWVWREVAQLVCKSYCFPLVVIPVTGEMEGYLLGCSCKLCCM